MNRIIVSQEGRENSKNIIRVVIDSKSVTPIVSGLEDIVDVIDKDRMNDRVIVGIIRQCVL